MNDSVKMISPCAPQPTPTRVTCLLVDDVAENLVALQALLQDEDLEILTARSGVEALELLLVHDVALALVDVQMPGMDGFELAELIRGSERTRHVPLIFVTAGTRDQHRMFKGYETGAVDFLYKPIDPYILSSKVKVFFELYRQKRALAHELHERTETLRMNEMFMAVLGHDLRTPLSAILHSAYLLKRGNHPDPHLTDKLVDRVINSSQRISGMIEDLLDVSRARLGGGIHIEREDHDLGTIVHKNVQEQHSAHPERAITVQASGALSGQWDGNRLSQVASNLIANALHHGEREGAIELRLDGEDAHQVILEVSNQGQIPAPVLSHIFDPFRGGERSSDRHEGLGLGLYIVHQIVQAHQGTITVMSHGGVTTFRITLPRA